MIEKVDQKANGSSFIDWLINLMAMVGRETYNHEWMENWQRNGAVISMKDKVFQWTKMIKKWRGREERLGQLFKGYRLCKMC